MILQFFVNGIITGFAYALIALGFGLIYNTTRIFNFAHGAIYTLTAYIFYSFYIIFGWPILPAVMASLGSAAIAGILIDELVYWPLVKRGSSLLVLLLSSLGVYIVIINLIALIFGNENTTISPGVQPAYYVGPIIITRIQLIIVATFVVLSCVLFFVLKRTDLGKVIRAMRDDPELLSVMGINQRRVRRAVFALGSTLSSVTAILLGIDVGIDPHIGMAAILNGAVAVIIGGVGIFEGAVFGALTLGVLQSAVVWSTSARWSEAIAFVVLILFLLLRPSGIAGRRRRVEEMAR